MVKELASYQTVRTRLEGISAVPITPFDETGGVHEDGVRRVVARLVAAGPDVFSFARLIERFPDSVVWVCGLAEMWAPFWLVGGRGFTSGLVNVAPDVSLAMLAALREGDYDEAMRVWARIVPFEELRAREGNGNNVSVVKEAMALRAIVGSTVRPPLAPLSRADAEELASILATWGTENA